MALTDENREFLAPMAAEARNWLFFSAAPVWSEVGWRDDGLFAERIMQDGAADPAPRRIFVQARMIYSFAALGSLGWEGPWRVKIATASDRLLSQAKREDGFFLHCLTHNGDIHDPRADLYDQAFVLLAFAAAGAMLGRAFLFEEAENLASLLEAQWKKPDGGYFEGEISDPKIRNQNPHMHLFEAFLLLYRITGSLNWRRRAEEVGLFCCNHFYDTGSGALVERRAENLSPLSGTSGLVVEPGHCCEWAWLLEKVISWDFERALPYSDSLTAFARAFGVDDKRGVMLDEVLLAGKPHNRRARLWPQTERLKAALARFARTNDPEEGREVEKAWKGLRVYLDASSPGLWRDKLKPDGNWEDEPAPGSSFYHIVCAYLDLLRMTWGNDDWI